MKMHLICRERQIQVPSITAIVILDLFNCEFLQEFRQDLRIHSDCFTKYQETYQGNRNVACFLGDKDSALKIVNHQI